MGTLHRFVVDRTKVGEIVVPQTVIGVASADTVEEARDDAIAHVAGRYGVPADRLAGRIRLAFVEVDSAAPDGAVDRALAIPEEAA